ncbi:MAG: phospho-N-acetylmuramoyl-pentapeptide-transferase [Oscillospiraceae bacterium]|nr:phospho-N-acetylmuramoyl-pentapeptide-transferase [Oscillospiraceae bacterium]
MNIISLIIVAVVAFAITSISGKWVIPYLKKLKFGQTILDIGPNWHKSKQGTPTMGGIMFVLGTVLAIALGVVLLAVFSDSFSWQQIFLAVIIPLAYCFIGFVDDYIKVVKKRNMGLSASQKIIMQVLVAIIYIVLLKLNGMVSTIVTFPFIGQIDIGLLYYPLAFIIIIGFVNAVNLTDGIDGLASSVTFVVAIAFIVLGAVLSSPETSVVASALAGGCLGFLIWNFHPAKVFMGDTGSMFLGGAVVALTFMIKEPLVILMCGIIYLIEAFSVMIQVCYFKATKGKRLFKMTPIHHHFEMSGYSEEKIVFLFSFVTLIGSALAVVAFVYF